MQDRTIARRIPARVDKLGHYIELISGTLCVTFFATMLAVILLGVFFRYVMADPFDWTEELARFLNLGLGFLAINIALRRNEHIAILLAVQRLPAPLIKVLDYLIYFLIAFFLIILTRQGVLMASRTMMTGAALDISMFWPYLTVPVGAGLTLIQLIINLTKQIIADFANTPAQG